MKINKLNLMWILTFIFILILSVTSFAATGSFTVSKSSVSLTEGDKTTFSIVASNCEGRFSISSSNSEVVKVSSSSVWITGSQSITLTAVKAGTAKITVKAENVGDTSENDVTGSKTISVTVKAKSSSTTNNEESTTTKPTFTSTNKTVYAKDNINLRSSWSTSSSATSVSKGTEMTLTGTSTKKVNGYIWYRVSYKGATKYVSSSLITTTKPSTTTNDKKDEESKNKAKSVNLKSLTVTPTGLSPSFSSGTTEYTMTIGSDIDEIDVKAIAEDEKASVNITGNTDLKIGTNKIIITVSDNDKTIKTYNISVTKEDKKQLQLTELLVEGLPLDPEFDSNIYEYTLELDRSDVSEINVTATPSKKSADVEIVGNTDLQPGENVVTILVKSADGQEITTYQITVKVPKVANVVQDNNKNMYVYIGIGACVLLVLIIIIAIIIKRRHQDEDNMYYGMYNTKENTDEEKVKSEVEKIYDKEEQPENIDLDKLPKLDEEDLPKSLRKYEEEKQEVKVDTSSMEQKDEALKEEIRTERSKKIDEFYHVDDESKAKRKGKHF